MTLRLLPVSLAAKPEQQQVTARSLATQFSFSTFDLSRYMGASLTMIDGQYGHLTRDGREYAIPHSTNWARNVRGRRWWTLRGRQSRQRRQQRQRRYRLSIPEL
jgi:hypothetical protein